MGHVERPLNWNIRKFSLTPVAGRILQKIERFLWRDFSGEEFREKHYLSTTLFPLIGCGVDSYNPELEHL